jgi:two-component system OmpR family sensor kinase
MLDRVETSVNQEQEAKERLRAFIDDVSHELRTPVTTIHGYAELFEQGALPTDTSVTQAMGRIQEESARMAILIEELLTLARMDMVRVPQRLPVDLTQVASSVVADAKVTAPERDLAFEGDDGLTLIGDRDRLRQAISNLVQNALTHTPADTRVDVTTYPEGEAVVVEVHDEAGSISADHLPRLFDRAWRADETGSTYGLGLSIVKRIVDDHGGVVETSSDPERGTRFRIVLPRTLATDVPGEDQVERIQSEIPVAARLTQGATTADR